MMPKEQTIFFVINSCCLANMLMHLGGSFYAELDLLLDRQRRHSRLVIHVFNSKFHLISVFDFCQ